MGIPKYTSIVSQISIKVKYLFDAAERRLSTYTTNRDAVALVAVVLRGQRTSIGVQKVRAVIMVCCGRPVEPAGSAIVKRPLIVVARANER